MNEQFRRATAAIPELFHRLITSEPFLEKGIAAQKGKSGVYAFFENDVPVHVGRTRNLGGRLRGHITKSHFSASFAFKRTRREKNVVATYVTAGSRAALVKEAEFEAEFFRQIGLVKLIHVRFVEIADPIAQYLLELYAHLTRIAFRQVRDPLTDEFRSCQFRKRL
ncbi:hypothetical protein NLM27_26645 [Bradyrhizobium sp. CCGB12]|uniref:hypothetical protein n=1 Tax=Bradyrhizobium sp. CCGB12 TaxID=2949632 RepID=UPI0020B31A92|nr:hypothetical protein [Bradyrhizobium sp. CCGB12]MCP3392332.1 hypothetical protein [Bradyrhizobium sp. CCGB12]